MKEQLQKIKTHIKDHKEAYITGGVCFVVGAAGAVLLMKFNESQTATINSPVEINGDKNVVNIVNTIIQNAGRNGHPGFVIFCHETNKAYRSIREAGRDLGLNPRNISEYFKGDVSDVAGHTFTKLGEAVAPS